MLFSKVNKNNNPVRCLSIPHARIVALIVSGIAPVCVNAQTPAELIAQADQFADQSDWQKAGPLYAKAEAEYHRTGDTRNELYAKLGRLHRDLEKGSYSTVRTEVVNALAIPVAQNDPALTNPRTRPAGQHRSEYQHRRSSRGLERGPRNRIKDRRSEMGEPRKRRIGTGSGR